MRNRIQSFVQNDRGNELKRLLDYAGVLAKAGTEVPVRMSSLPMLFSCPTQWAADFISATAKLKKPRIYKATQAGTLFHKAVELWHTDKKQLPEWFRASRMRFGGEVMKDVERWFAKYTTDKRNHTTLVATEITVTTEVEGVQFVGHLDQLRPGEIKGQVELVDLKTGAPGGEDMLQYYAPQLAGYLVGARALGYRVESVWVCRVRGYTGRKHTRVWWEMPLTTADAEWLLRTAAEKVKEIARGKIAPSPYKACLTYCPFRGVNHCIPFARRIKNRLTGY